MPRSLVRAAVLASTVALTAYATAELARVFPFDDAGVLEFAMLVLFVPCFAWAASGVLFVAFGLLAAAWPDRAAPPPRAAPGTVPADGVRTAVLLPIRHEDAGRVAAAVEAMYRALEGRPTGRTIDFFLLSDSTDPEIALAEEVAWRSLSERIDGFGRVFYRRRGNPEGKKAGNIRDFCLRHGRDYRYIVVLDADSVMSAETLCALVERMEANPRVGILQVPPLPVRRTTLFARWIQFAARVYGPLWATADAALCGPDANYYGHNAIIRTEAFSGHAGLGLLPGAGPLSGLIASHDFVEAALVRRAGYEVWLAADLGGSYEQCPTTVIDYAVRDERWCHGNLQHLRIATLPGLASWSRTHLVRGALAYLISPVVLAFTCVMLLAAARDVASTPVYFAPAERTLFPLWPVHDLAAARALCWLTVALLVGPRLVAALVSLAAMTWRGLLPLRRVPSFLLSVVAELALGTLLGPVLMLFHTVFVARSAFGERVSWVTGVRDERRVPLAEAWRRCWLHVVCAVVLGAGSLLVSEQAFLWTLPLAAPLLAAPLLTSLTSSETLARWAAHLRLFQTPEDWETAGALAAYDTAPTPRPNVPAALGDPTAAAWHALAALGSGLVTRIPPERRDELRRRLAEGAPMDAAEQQACLTDVELLLEAMSRKPESRPPSRPAER